jgi:peptide/nickel transport system substrate-binding protein
MDREHNYWQVFGRRPLSRRRAIALGGVGFLAAGAMACNAGNKRAPQSAATSGAVVADQPQAGGTYITATPVNPPSLDPQRTMSGYAAFVIGFSMSRLFRFKTAQDPQVWRNHDVEGDLAVSAASPDGITWTIKLRPDATFQNLPPVNGHAVEADDIKASFTRALDPLNPSGSSLDMIDASQIQTPDKHTVVFKLKYPYAPFQSLLASSTYSWILPREASADGYDPAKQVIGSGPFLLDKYTPDVEVLYKKNGSRIQKPSRSSRDRHSRAIFSTRNSAIPPPSSRTSEPARASQWRLTAIPLPSRSMAPT